METSIIERTRLYQVLACSPLKSKALKVTSIMESLDYVKLFSCSLRLDMIEVRVLLQCYISRSTVWKSAQSSYENYQLDVSATE
jgi:hypothetical protein